jgi:CubicO group peptidase (beta-lactamase class C family)
MWPVGGIGGRRGVATGMVVAIAVVLAVSTAGVSAAPARDADPVASVVERFRTEIPRLMTEQGIPGLSVAVVDGARPLWVEGFGHVDGPESPAVTGDTIFSVQSISKVFTASAVMRAVQDGLVSLDEPITTYLPGFTVHSAFEANPERRITLRMLLSHTAGFTHEAPVGNNAAIASGTFDAHVRSISDTWLRFPVGTGYAYSNLGIDLAGAILERVRGEPFAALMDNTLLAPLGMDHSTFDRASIRATADRAVGHYFGVAAPLVDVPMTAAGGLYSSASDMARFLGFQVDGGSIDGHAILGPALVEEMRTVPAPNAGAPAGYALGVSRTRWRAEGYQDLFSHGGGGFGFLADLWWAPRIGIGVAVLTNAGDHHLQGALAISILRAFVDAPGSVFGERLATLPSQSEFADEAGAFDPPADLPDRIAAVAMPVSQGQADRWAGYVGGYRVPTWGFVDPSVAPDRFLVDDGVAFFETSETGARERHRLTELQPGLFLADNGEVLDLRSTPITWRNLEVVPAQGGPSASQAALLAGILVVALGGLLASAVGAVRARRRHARAEGALRGGRAWLTSRAGLVVATALLAILTAILVVASVALVAALPGLVDSGFVGWLGLPLALRLAVHLPIATAVVGALLCLVVLGAWVRRAWPPGARAGMTALALSTVALVAQLAAWRLIGWGF